MFSIRSALAVALVLIFSRAHGMQNEPTDFLGIAWGKALSDMRGDLKPISETNDGGHFRRLSDRPFYAGIEVRRISYYFYQGQFTSGTFLTVGTNDLKTIVAHLTDRYGPAKVVNPRHKIYAWEGERTGITVSCDITISCYTEFYDMALRLKEQAAEAPARASE